MDHSASRHDATSARRLHALPDTKCPDIAAGALHHFSFAAALILHTGVHACFALTSEISSFFRDLLWSAGMLCPHVYPSKICSLCHNFSTPVFPQELANVTHSLISHPSKAPLLSPQELANVVYAYGLMWSRPEHPRTLPLLLSWALQHARWGQLTPQNAVAAFGGKQRASQTTYSLQGAANIVWGAARMHIAKDPSHSNPAIGLRGRAAVPKLLNREPSVPRQPAAGARKVDSHTNAALKSPSCQSSLTAAGASTHQAHVLRHASFAPQRHQSRGSSRQSFAGIANTGAAQQARQPAGGGGGGGRHLVGSALNVPGIADHDHVSDDKHNLRVFGSSSGSGGDEGSINRGHDLARRGVDGARDDDGGGSGGDGVDGNRACGGAGAGGARDDDGGGSGGDGRWASKAAVVRTRSRPVFDGVWLHQLLQAFQHRDAGASGSPAVCKDGGMDCSNFTTQGVANILWGAAVLGADPGKEAVEWLIAQAGVGQDGVPRGAAGAVQSSSSGVNFEGLAGRQISWALQRLGYQQAPP
eukprot:1159273-Pelagomonas_calceolata.AAC.1